LDPRNSVGTRVDSGPAADPFETTITQYEQQLGALRAVKDAQKALNDSRERASKLVANAEKYLADCEKKAAQLGAYELVPAHLRPALRVAS
jgi:hypothetical protein